MDKERSKRLSPPGGTVTAAIALLLVVCFAECATGSCLSYGHSCWGAHGKRSGKAPGAAPDWFLDKLFRSTHSASPELHRSRARNDDIDAIYQGDAPNDSSSTDRLGADSADLTVETAMNKDREAKPMLDDELLSKIKLWQIMREASAE